MTRHIINPVTETNQVVLEVWRAGLGNWCGRIRQGFPHNDQVAVGFRTSKELEASSKAARNGLGCEITKVVKLKKHPFDLTKPFTDTGTFDIRITTQLAARGIRNTQDLLACSERGLADAILGGRAINQIKLHLQSVGQRLKPDPVGRGLLRPKNKGRATPDLTPSGTALDMGLNHECRQ